METIRIVRYQPEFQPRIDRMMVRIQDEFAEQITSRHSTILSQVYQLPRQAYWVALYGEEVTGTIGMVLFGDHNAVVKRMMVDPAYRGNHFPTAKILLDTGLSWAREQEAQHVFLGTMNQFIGAQKFYLKNGFEEIPEKELPSAYPANPMDTLFYKLML
jgi:N-acetylglutamate synthase-like GNAT family acetyltransferase